VSKYFGFRNKLLKLGYLSIDDRSVGATKKHFGVLLKLLIWIGVIRLLSETRNFVPAATVKMIHEQCAAVQFMPTFLKSNRNAHFHIITEQSKSRDIFHYITPNKETTMKSKDNM
ncbi:hypothetical protein ACJX0J_016482, partial [Zea mays]